MRSSVIILPLVIILSAVCSVEPVEARPKNAAAATAPLQQAYVWYDGSRERKIWLDPQLVSEFHSGKGTAAAKSVTATTAKDGIKNLFPHAVRVPGRHGSVRLWRLGAGADANAAVRALRSANFTGAYSPVLHDGPTEKGRMRALPGNVIVYLNPAWDEKAVAKWASRNQLDVVRKLESGPNMYLIKTGPGLEAVETANAIYQSGEVIAAFPDWWQEITAR